MHWLRLSLDPDNVVYGNDDRMISTLKAMQEAEQAGERRSIRSPSVPV
jgi:hypothetical protein